MNRTLLIAGGTLGGLGAVMAIIPPQLGSTTLIGGGIPQTTPTASASATPTTAPTTAPSAGVTGSFSGDAISMRYGIVQVKITVKNGKITDAQALQAPTGSNDRYTQLALPGLRQQTIAAQSANIKGVSGASYTSYAWYQSLASAIAQAGL